jgi:hypothetical protein
MLPLSLLGCVLCCHYQLCEIQMYKVGMPYNIITAIHVSYNIIQFFNLQAGGTHSMVISYT